MPVGPDFGQHRSMSPDSAAHEAGPVFKLMPILLGLIAGMLIMLGIVHFFPRDNNEANMQTTEQASSEQASGESAAAPPALENNDNGQASGSTGQMTVIRTTPSGYPVVTSGAPRAVDYAGSQSDGIDPNNQPQVVPSENASTNPCVDPPSVQGRAYRVVDR